MYQPKLPVENCFTSASISWPLIETLSGSAFSRNCVSETGQEVLGGIAGASYTAFCAAAWRCTHGAAQRRRARNARCPNAATTSACSIAPSRSSSVTSRSGTVSTVDDLAAVEAAGRAVRLGIEREVAVQVVVLIAGFGATLPSCCHVARRVAGLLDELARRGGLRVFARVDHAAGDLEAHLLDADPVLADQHDVLVGRQRDHVDPVDRFDQREPLRAGARVRAVDERGREDAVVVTGVARAEAPREISSSLISCNPRRLRCGPIVGG